MLFNKYLRAYVSDPIYDGFSVTGTYIRTAGLGASQTSLDLADLLLHRGYYAHLYLHVHAGKSPFFLCQFVPSLPYTKLIFVQCIVSIQTYTGSTFSILVHWSNGLACTNTPNSFVKSLDIWLWEFPYIITQNFQNVPVILAFLYFHKHFVFVPCYKTLLAYWMESLGMNLWRIAIVTTKSIPIHTHSISICLGILFMFNKLRNLLRSHKGLKHTYC